MSTSNATATAAPSTITLAGKKFTMTPMKYNEYGVFERWMQKKHVDGVRETTKDWPEEESRPHLTKAVDEAKELLFGAAKSNVYMMSHEGQTQLMFLSLSKHHSELTIEEVSAMLTDPKTLELLWDEFDRINETGDYVPKKVLGPLLRAKRKGQWTKRKKRNSKGQ